MQDDGDRPEADDEPIDLDDDEPIDLDDDEPLDVREAVAALPESAPSREPEPIPLDLGDVPGPGIPLDWRSLSDERERERAIEEVLRDQVRRQALRQAAYRPPAPPWPVRVAAGLLAIAALVAWIFPVPGLQPEIPFPLPPEEEQAALRLATWVQAQQVEAFRRERGRLPDVLRETGEALPGMSYQRMDAQTYRLTGTTERTSVTWVSSDTVDGGLSGAAARLRGGSP